MTFVDDGGAGALLHRPAAPFEMGRSAMTVLAPPAATAGRYSLYRFDLQPRSGGPGPHLHRTFAESFVVLSGEVELYDGVRWSVGRPSDHLCVPEGVVHAFRHRADEPASILVLSTPAAPREDYFAELAALLGRDHEATLPELLDLWARHDTYPPPG
jgi:mannose-6-phosphate isomerase-like protein (cupin superfamily)